MCLKVEAKVFAGNAKLLLGVYLFHFCCRAVFKTISQTIDNNVNFDNFPNVHCAGRNFEGRTVKHSQVQKRKQREVGLRA